MLACNGAADTSSPHSGASTVAASGELAAPAPERPTAPADIRPGQVNHSNRPARAACQSLPTTGLAEPLQRTGVGAEGQRGLPQTSGVMRRAQRRLPAWRVAGLQVETAG